MEALGFDFLSVERSRTEIHLSLSQVALLLIELRFFSLVRSREDDDEEEDDAKMF